MKKTWLIVFGSIAALAFAGLDRFSFILMAGSVFLHWGLWRNQLHRTAVALQVMLFFALKLLFELGTSGTPGSLISLGALSIPHFPRGFSFYSLSLIALHVDALRRRPVALALSEFIALVVYAPKFFAGPIERAGTFVRELRIRRRLRGRAWLACGRLIAWGAFKKFCVANPLWPFVESTVLGERAERDFFLFALGLYALALHFYAEFTGYVDMARGISRLFGVRLSQNYRAPFLAVNPPDFWRRWHLTLSAWLRDYVYYPVYFRTKKIELAVAATFLGVGLWHGIAAHQVLLGAYWAALVVLHLWFQPALMALRSRLPGLLQGGVWLWCSRACMWHVICFGFLFLYSPDWWSILASVRFEGAWSGYHSRMIARLAFYFVPFVFAHWQRPSRITRDFLLLYLAVLILLFREGQVLRLDFLYFQY